MKKNKKKFLLDPHSTFHIPHSTRGFTLIESMVFLLLFALIASIFFQTYSTATRLIIESKNRLGATALANQKMEIIRSIDYTTIGTKHWNGSAWVYGIPAGEILEDENVTVNTTTYAVHTFVQYVDNAFDGQSGGATNDTIPTDYKRARITVSWGLGGTDQTVVLFGNFSPNGVETSGGDGVLSINVLDATGNGVSGATVRVVNSAASIDTTGATDSTGNITLPGATAGMEAYELTLSKSGYYGAVTYPAYPTSAYNPVDVHATVATGVLNQKTVVMDQEVDITFKTEDPFGTDIPNIGYTLSGGRVLGTDPGTGGSVYGFTDTGTTNGSGEAEYPDESYGQYTVSTSSPDYEFYRLTPEGSAVDVFDASPGAAAAITAVLLDKNIGSVKIIVANQADSTPIAGASVRLRNIGLAYDATVTTDSFGQAYFPTTLPELLDGTYDIEVTASGFGNESDTASVTGALETQTIQMTAN